DSGNAIVVYIEAGLGSTPGPQVALDLAYRCDASAPWSLKPTSTPMSGQATRGSITDAYDVPFRRLELHRRLTLMAGKPDPDHPQEVTVRYAIDGEEGTIRLHLRQLGWMDIKIVDGPLTYPNAHAWAES